MFQVLGRLSSKSYLARSQNEKVIKYTHSRTHTHILQERISLWKKNKKTQLTQNCQRRSLCVETARSAVDRVQEAITLVVAFFSPPKHVKVLPGSVGS